MLRLLNSVRGRWRVAARAAVFVHVPKTAGSSLRKWVLEQIGRRPSFRIIHPVEDRARLAALPLEERRRLALVEGHLYYGLHEDLPRPAAYFTMLREPVERVLSFYSYVREFTPHYLHEIVVGGGVSLRECIERGLTVELDNHMVRTLAGYAYGDVPIGGVTEEMMDAAKANLVTFAAVGITERFEESVAVLRREFGWKGSPAERVNVTAERVRTEDLEAGTVELIRERNRLDVGLYEHARGLLERRLAAEGLREGPMAPDGCGGFHSPWR